MLSSGFSWWAPSGCSWFLATPCFFSCSRKRQVWNVGFLLGHVRGQPVPCRFCGAPDGDGHLFWECTFPPLVEIRENLEFHDLMRMDKGHWPRCLLWHGWLPMLSGVDGASPWALDASESAAYLVEVALGRYSSSLATEWDLSPDFDHDDAAASLTDHPNVWTDGSLVLDQVSGVSSSGSGFFAHQAERFWRGCRWGHVDGVHPHLDRAYCRGFSSVPGPLKTVQRAEMWGVVLALQTSRAVHLGVDNLGVVRHVDRLLRGCRGPRPFQPVNDGDLLLLLEHMLNRRGLDTVQVSKVKGHADDAMVLHGQVRQDDRLGNDAADEAADFGRRRVSLAVIDARRNLSGVCGRWYPFILDLHRFFIAIARAVVNIMMILVVLLLILLFGLVVLIPRGVVWFMRFGTGLFCLGHLVFGIRNGFMFLHLLSALRTLLIGPKPLVYWLSGSLS